MSKGSIVMVPGKLWGCGERPVHSVKGSGEEGWVGERTGEEASEGKTKGVRLDLTWRAEEGVEEGEPDEI